jgi:hypothetical protein
MVTDLLIDGAMLTAARDIGWDIDVTAAVTFELLNDRPAPAALGVHFPDAQLAACCGAHLFSTSGMPVSTSQAEVGAELDLLSRCRFF